MPKKRTKKNIQAKYRRTTFSTAQYWNINYTERYTSGLEKDFKTIILAKSFELAVHILNCRLYEEHPGIKVKALHGFMFHKKYHSNSNGRLGVKEWEQIRKSSFPNENNFLFKVEIPREEGKTNRFNKTDYDHLKSIGFPKGESNWSKRHRKGKVLPMEERTHKVWRGQWVDWSPSLRQDAKNKLINALVKSKNSRTHAANLLGINRNKIYKLFQKFPEIDWKKEYPPPPPLRPARRNGCSTMAQKKAILEEMVPKIDKTLKATGGNRAQAARLLGFSTSVFFKMLRSTRNRIDWSEKYPSKFSNKKNESKS